MALDIIAIVTAAPGKEDAVEELLNTLADGVKSEEPKTQRYKPYKCINSEDGTTEFVMIERLVLLTLCQLTVSVDSTRQSADLVNRYPDQECLDAHQATEHYKTAMKRGADESLLAKPPTIMKMQALAGGYDTR
jgi:quinol monooxygenase YgiN